MGYYGISTLLSLRRRRNTSALGMGICSAIALVIMLVAYSFQQHSKAEIVKQCTESTQGVVTYVDMERHHSRRRTTYKYRGTVEFQIGEQLYTARTPAYSSSSAVRVGKSYTVWYDPSDPSRNCVEDKEYDKEQRTMYYIMIGVMLIISVIAFIVAYRRKKANTVVLNEHLSDPGYSGYTQNNYDDIFK